MRKFLFVFALFAFTAVASTHVQASQPRLLSVDGAWSAYVFTEDGGKVCYMASKPSKSQGNYSRRGEIFTLITHRAKERTRNVCSYSTGYAYKPGSDVTVDIDGEVFVLFTQDETAWAPDGDTDDRIVEAIRNDWPGESPLKLADLEYQHRETAAIRDGTPLGGSAPSNCQRPRLRLERR